MNCTEVQELLPALIYGDLEPEARTAVETHLAQCAGCREEQAALGAAHVPAVRVRADAARFQMQKESAQEHVHADQPGGHRNGRGALEGERCQPSISGYRDHGADRWDEREAGGIGLYRSGKRRPACRTDG